ncbi:MAG: sulfatase [Planctomycetota bacterium]|nr:sulfatase [Planctomycetota bacterium]
MRRLLLSLLIGTLSACGGGDDSEQWDGDASRVAGGLVRLNLAGSDPGYTVGDIVPYRNLRVLEGELPDGWSTPEHVERVHETRPAFGGEWHGLRFNTKGHLVIQQSFDPSKFNRAVIELALNAKADLYIELRRKGEQLFRSGRVRVDGVRKPQLAVLDLPETLGVDGTVDQLRLVVVPQGGKPAILGIDLVQTPIGSWLPTPEEGPAPVALPGAKQEPWEARHAQGLSSRNPLVATVEAPPKSSLRFSYSLPKEVHRHGDKLAILVEVEDAQGRNLAGERFPVSKPGHWYDGEVRLTAEGEVTVRYTLEGARHGLESLVALASPRFERKVKDSPSVLLVTSDTHRADHLGAGGMVSTPFLDRLGESGIVFEDCHAAINITNPSHASILTGLSARNTGVVDNITALSDDAVTLAEQFQAAGYYTLASLSAPHMNHSQSGLGQGFDQVAFPGNSAIDSPKAIEPMLRWLEESSQRPVFVWLHIFDAHAPYEVPESHRWLYYDESRDPYDPDLPLLESRAVAPWDTNLRDAAYLVAQYRSEVTFLDQQLATALAHDRLRDALVAITSDHGEHFGSHGLYWTHQGLYPETLAVPLILSWPGGPTGVRVSAPVDQLDLGRTLLDLADVGWAEFPGKNLMRHVDGQPKEAPRYSIGSHGMAASISYQGYYLVLNLRAHASPPRKPHQVELYRPAEDPTCLHDLVDEEFEQAKELRALLVKWLEDAPTQTFARRSDVSDPEVLAQLAALGYATDVASEETSEGWYTRDPNNSWDQRFE